MRHGIELSHTFHLFCIQGRTVRVPKCHSIPRQTGVHEDSEVAYLNGEMLRYPSKYQEIVELYFMREWYVSFLSAAYHFSCLLHLWSKGMKSTLPSSKQSGGLPCLRVPRISWPFLSTHQQKPVELWHWRRSYSPVRLQSGTKRPGGGTVSRPKASKRSFKHRVKPAAEENVKLCCIHNVKVFCFCESVSSEKQIIDSVA